MIENPKVRKTAAVGVVVIIIATLALVWLIERIIRWFN